MTDTIKTQEGNTLQALKLAVTLAELNKISGINVTGEQLNEVVAAIAPLTISQGGADIKLRPYTSTLDQTIINTNYAIDNLIVIIGGFVLSPDDYTATDGISITLHTPIPQADLPILVLSWVNYTSAGGKTGGITGQVLTKASDVDLDYKWTTPISPESIPASPFTKVEYIPGMSYFPVTLGGSGTLILQANNTIYGGIYISQEINIDAFTFEITTADTVNDYNVILVEINPLTGKTGNEIVRSANFIPSATGITTILIEETVVPKGLYAIGILSATGAATCYVRHGTPINNIGHAYYNPNANGNGFRSLQYQCGYIIYGSISRTNGTTSNISLTASVGSSIPLVGVRIATPVIP